jgi:acyl carrier protein
VLSAPGTERRLRKIIAEVALVPADSFTAEAELAGAGIDSLSVLRAVAEVEASFGITIPDESFARVRTLRALAEIVDHEVARKGELLHQ